MIFVHIPKTGGTTIEYLLGMHGNFKTVGLEETNHWKTFNTKNLFGGHATHWTIKELKRRLKKKIFETYYKFTIVRNPYTRLISEIAWYNNYRSWQTNEKMPVNLFKKKFNEIYSNYKEKKKNILAWKTEFKRKRWSFLVILISYLVATIPRREPGVRLNRRIKIIRIKINLIKLILITLVKYMIKILFFVSRKQLIDIDKAFMCAKLYLEYKYSGESILIDSFDRAHFIPQYYFMYVQNKRCVDRVFKLEDFEEIEKFLIKKIGTYNIEEKRMKTHQEERSRYLDIEIKDKIYEMYKKDFEYFNYEK